MDIPVGYIIAVFVVVVLLLYALNRTPMEKPWPLIVYGSAAIILAIVLLSLLTGSPLRLR